METLVLWMTRLITCTNPGEEQQEKQAKQEKQEEKQKDSLSEEEDEEDAKQRQQWSLQLEVGQVMEQHECISLPYHVFVATLADIHSSKQWTCDATNNTTASTQWMDPTTWSLVVEQHVPKTPTSGVIQCTVHSHESQQQDKKPVMVQVHKRTRACGLWRHWNPFDSSGGGGGGDNNGPTIIVRGTQVRFDDDAEEEEASGDDDEEEDEDGDIKMADDRTKDAKNQYKGCLHRRGVLLSNIAHPQVKLGLSLCRVVQGTQQQQSNWFPCMEVMIPCGPTTTTAAPIQWVDGLLTRVLHRIAPRTYAHSLLPPCTRSYPTVSFQTVVDQAREMIETWQSIPCAELECRLGVLQSSTSSSSTPGADNGVPSSSSSSVPQFQAGVSADVFDRLFTQYILTPETTVSELRLDYIWERPDQTFRASLSQPDIAMRASSSSSSSALDLPIHVPDLILVQLESLHRLDVLHCVVYSHVHDSRSSSSVSSSLSSSAGLCPMVRLAVKNERRHLQSIADLGPPTKIRLKHILRREKWTEDLTLDASRVVEAATKEEAIIKWNQCLAAVAVAAVSPVSAVSDVSDGTSVAKFSYEIELEHKRLTTLSSVSAFDMGSSKSSSSSSSRTRGGGRVGTTIRSRRASASTSSSSSATTPTSRKDLSMMSLVPAPCGDIAARLLFHSAQLTRLLYGGDAGDDDDNNHQTTPTSAKETKRILLAGDWKIVNSVDTIPIVAAIREHETHGVYGHSGHGGNRGGGPRRGRRGQTIRGARHQRGRGRGRGRR